MATRLATTILGDLDARLEASKERIERLREQLESHLQQAEALLGEPVTQ